VFLNIQSFITQCHPDADKIDSISFSNCIAKFLSVVFLPICISLFYQLNFANFMCKIVSCPMLICFSVITNEIEQISYTAWIFWSDLIASSFNLTIFPFGSFISSWLLKKLNLFHIFLVMFFFCDLIISYKFPSFSVWLPVFFFFGSSGVELGLVLGRYHLMFFF
jgi:hypothetical protein